MIALPGEPLIRDVLVDPRASAGWSLREWDLCIRQAVRADLLARLASDFRNAALLDTIPKVARNHLISAEILAAKHVRDVAYELERIHEALAPLELPVVLLKGAAYRAAGFDFARSRSTLR